MKTLTLLPIILLGFGVAACGAPCPNTATLDQLIALGAAGCTATDTTFSNFTYSLGDANQVMATLIVSIGPNVQNIRAWSFTRVGTPWTANFQISYNVTTANGVSIIGSKDQLNTGPIPNTTSVVDTQIPPVVLNTNGSSTASETAQASYPGVGTLKTTSVVTMASASDMLVTLDQVFIISGAPAEDVLLVNYASNLLAGDSVVNFTNTGVRNGFDPAGGICANFYIFDPSEELVSCCSCYVTPDGLKSVSAKTDLVSNTLTPGVPGSIVIKMLASVPGAGNTCNAGTVTAATVESGLKAWRTTLHQNTVSGNFEATENIFLGTPISDTEFQKLTTYCSFIQANGSGFGICKSCRLGGLGGSQK